MIEYINEQLIGPVKSAEKVDDPYSSVTVSIVFAMRSRVKNTENRNNITFAGRCFILLDSFVSSSSNPFFMVHGSQ